MAAERLLPEAAGAGAAKLPADVSLRADAAERSLTRLRRG